MEANLDFTCYIHYCLGTLHFEGEKLIDIKPGLSSLMLNTKDFNSEFKVGYLTKLQVGIKEDTPLANRHLDYNQVETMEVENLD